MAISLQTKKKIVEYLTKQGYKATNEFRYVKYFDGREKGEWERNLHIDIVGVCTNKFWVQAQIKVFRNTGHIDNKIVIQKEIHGVGDIEFWERKLKLTDFIKKHFDL